MSELCWSKRRAKSEVEPVYKSPVVLLRSTYTLNMLKVARPGRLELPTLCLEGRRSIQLSYGRTALNFSYYKGLCHGVRGKRNFRVDGALPRLF
jgi:hypothetical protein